MQKRVFIIHGWEGRPGEHWMPWLRKKLEASSYEVIEPTMPDTNEPIIEKWVSHLASVVGDLDENTYFVGHSVGCQTILRYLETHVGKKAGGCVFVAGWFKLGNLESEDIEKIAEPWVKGDMDFTKILKTTKNFIVINSSNDDYDFVQENKKMFEEKLGARVTILENKGHLIEADGVTELPEALAAVQEFAMSGH